MRLAAIFLLISIVNLHSFHVTHNGMLKRIHSLQMLSVKDSMTELLVPVDQGSRRGRYSSSALSVKKNEAAEPDSGLGEYKGEVKRTLAWVGAAVGFGGAIGYVQGIDKAIEFISGYFLEESLSIDNIFVFLLLFDYFKVPKKDELKILEYGIFGAVVLRGLFIGLGAVALENFHQLLLGFAAILYVASYKIIFGGEGGDDEEDVSENTVVKFAKAYFKSSDQFDGDKFFTIDNGVRLATPLFLCLVCIEISDIIFAFDSVPAIFGVTDDPFIVFTSNIFAILSLRSLYGVLSKAVSQLRYLEKAVGVVLGVIAVKLTGSCFDVELLDPLQSLIAVLGILSTGVGLSLVKGSATLSADQ